MTEKSGGEPGAKTGNRWSRILAVAGLVFFLGGQGVPIHRAVAAHPWQTGAVVLLAAFAVSGPRRDRLRDIAEALFRVPRLRFNGGVFAVSCLAYALVARLVFQGIPRIDDGSAALFQARLFALGKIALPLPEDAAFFEALGVLGNQAGLGHWCAMYPPGWPLLLTPGVWLGVPWLVNPILGGLLVVTIGELGRNFYGDRTGRVAALLALPSPLVAVLSGLHLSHVPTALACGLCLLGLRKLWETARWIWGGLAGVSWGIAFLCRPLDAALIGAIFALGFFFPPNRFRRCGRGIAAGLAMALVAIALLLAYQEAATGDWRTPGHVVGMGARGHFGFGRLDKARIHTPAIGVDYVFRRLRVLNDHLLGWPIPALLLVMLPFVLGRAGGNGILLLLPMPALLLAYACFWYYENCVPGRYLSAAFPFLFVLAARGWFALRDALASRIRWRWLPAFLLVSGTLFLAVGAPDYWKRYDQSYYDVEDVLPRVVRDYGIAHAVVFMEAIGRKPNEKGIYNDYYATGFMRNRLDATGDVLYVRNLRERNVRMIQRHPGRTYWLYRYYRFTGKATLHRMVPDGNEWRLVPVKPATPDLIEMPEPPSP
ncbi:MAG: glycosyltransferase family 39 protein [Kiritimatiellia bacterium]